MLLYIFDLEATKGLYLSFYGLRSHGNVLEVIASNRVIKDKETHVILGVMHNTGMIDRLQMNFEACNRC